MSARRRSRRLISDINIVPYIDVMLVLLVIFMITAPLLTQGVKVNLPKAAAKVLKGKQKEPIIVSVDAKGRFYLNINRDPQAVVNAKFLVNRVASELKKSANTKPARLVLVKGDQSVDYGKVVQAMVLLQKAGATNIGLMTKSDGREHVKA